MTTIVGITGHSNLTADSYPSVRDALRKHLSQWRDGLVGMTCIARGADQIFADVVLELAGALDIVLPAVDYLDGIRDPGDRERCDGYVAAASSTTTMPFACSGPAAYAAAGRHVVDHCDLVVAVWDGSAPAGSGGTADAVAYAREHGVPVTRVWPGSARREC